MDQSLGYLLIELKDRVVTSFNGEHWDELGLLTGQSSLIDNHHRLLRSLSFGDSDYSECVLDVLKSMVKKQPDSLAIIEAYLDRKYPGDSLYISAKPSERKGVISLVRRFG